MGLTFPATFARHRRRRIPPSPAGGRRPRGPGPRLEVQCNPRFNFLVRVFVPVVFLALLLRCPLCLCWQPPPVNATEVLAALVRSWQPAARFERWRAVSDVCSLGDSRLSCSPAGALLALHLTKQEIVGSLVDDISKLTTLTALELDGNRFSGYLPWSLGTLTNLELLNLANNNLTGMLPSISNLKHLNTLRLDRNGLSGPLPSNFSALTKLTLFFANNNSFAGPLPAFFGNMTKLQQLKLYSNPMSGSLPESYSQLKNLTHLHLMDMRLNGPIPESWRHMTNLQYVHLERNNLSGDLPLALGHLTNLVELSLIHNPFLSGKLPPCWATLQSLGTLTVAATHLRCPTRPVDSCCPGTLQGDLPFCSYLCPTFCQECQPPPLSIGAIVGIVVALVVLLLSTLLAVIYVWYYARGPGSRKAWERELKQGFRKYTWREIMEATNHLSSVLTTAPTFPVPTNVPLAAWERELKQGFRKYTWREIMEATNHLSPANLLGKGGFGSVYWGVIGGQQQHQGWSSHIWKRDSGSSSTWLKGSNSSNSAIGSSSEETSAVGNGAASGGGTNTGGTTVCSSGLAVSSSGASVGSSCAGLGGKAGVAGGRVVVTGGMEVAVKRAAAVERSSDTATMFEEEVKAVSKLSHKNLVRLFGYCNEHNEQVLVYEFVRNGPLSDHLYARFKGHLLTFEERLGGALALAEGLKYLHFHAETPIVHRDIKPCNVLLTEDYQVKIADFGLLRTLTEGAEKEGAYTRVAGTRGYLDPEYMTCEKVSTASDVYSYGVLLLEMVTGRPATEKDPEDPSCLIHITTWTIPYVERGEIRIIADSRIATPLNLPFLLQMARTAALCVQLPSSRRPDMAEVARVMLEASRGFHAASFAAAAGAAAGGGVGVQPGGGQGGGGAATGGGKAEKTGREIGRSGSGRSVSERRVGSSIGAVGTESMKRWFQYFAGGGGRSRRESESFEEIMPSGTVQSSGREWSGPLVESENEYAVSGNVGNGNGVDSDKDKWGG